MKCCVLCMCVRVCVRERERDNTVILGGVLRVKIVHEVDFMFVIKNT